jgi:hypothetical protein
LNNDKGTGLRCFFPLIATCRKLPQTVVPTYAEIVSMTPQEVLDKAVAE